MPKIALRDQIPANSGEGADGRPEPIVPYTLMAAPTDPSAWVKALRRVRERWPNGTYDFRLGDVVDALQRIAAAAEWQAPPKEGQVVIKTWNNRHPRTLVNWLHTSAAPGGVVEVPHDSAPMWLSAATNLIERRLFLRMTCPRCSRTYLSADLTVERWSTDTPSFKAEGRRWLCPGGHELLNVPEWLMHTSNRAESYWRRQED